MKLLLDATNSPNSVVESAQNIAEQAGVDCEIIRNREPEFYKLNSRDFDEELRQAQSLETLRPLLENMEPGDILVTGDDNLAELAVHRVTVVLHPDGKVYTPETMDMLKIAKHINRLRGYGDKNPTPITHRNEKDDKAFVDLLIQYLDNVGEIENSH